MLVSKGHVATGITLIRVTCATGVVVMSQSGLILRTMSGFRVLPQPGSMVMSVVYGNTKGHTDAQGLSHNL